MTPVNRTFTADFGPGYADLSTVGYTLSGSSRSTSGVTQLASGTGIYNTIGAKLYQHAVERLPEFAKATQV